MRKPTRAIFIASVFTAGIAAASALYAQDNRGSSGSMMGRDVMMGGGMMEGGMMGSMMQMMDHCSQMMQGMNDGRGTERPNDRWKKSPGNKH
jgi:ribulose 1,5-bisphosphate synthetase/thiazole synthase